MSGNGGESFTSVVDASTVNSIRLGGGGRISKKPRSSGIKILNSEKTSIPPYGNRHSSSLNLVDLYSVED